METRSRMSRSLHTNRDFEKLEPYEGKPSRTVLRGEEGSNALDLPDHERIRHFFYFSSFLIFLFIHVFQYIRKSPLNNDGITNLVCTHSLCLITFAGLPLTTLIGGTSLTTTLPAPITDPYPIFLHEGKINASDAIHT